MDVTFAICCRNGERYLKEVLEALCRQRHVAFDRWEILLVDNGSTDDTARIFDAISREANRQPEMRLIVEPEPGQRTARKCAVHNARGKWVCFVDDDNLLNESYLARGLEFAATARRVGAFGGSSVARLEAPAPPHFAGFASALAVWDGGSVEREIGLNRKFTAGLFVLRAAAMEAMGGPWLMPGRTPAWPFGGEDAELCIQLINLGWKIWFVPGLVFEHIIPAGRMRLGYLLNLRARQGGEEAMLELAYARSALPLIGLWVGQLFMALLRCMAFLAMFVLPVSGTRWKNLSKAFNRVGFFRYAPLVFSKASAFRRQKCGNRRQIAPE